MAEDNNKISTEKLKSVIARNMKSLRKNYGITQDDLSNITGICRTQIAKYEIEDKLMGLDKLLCIAKALNVSPSVILDGWEIEL